MARPSSSCFFFLFACLVYSFFFPSFSQNEEITPLFIFGDATVDIGNNGFIKPNVTSRFLPYGVDFPTGPTGRYTNGFNLADVLAKLLNLSRSPPAVLDPMTKGEMILSGVNYASGGAAILLYPYYPYIPLTDQIHLFENTTLPDMRAQLEEIQLSAHLARSIFAFSVGDHDCTLPCTPSAGDGKCIFDFNLLLGNFTLHIMKVYRLGARKFVFFSPQLVGCSPHYIEHNNGTCIEYMNEAARKFSYMLRSSIDWLKLEMPAAIFVYVNCYKITSDIFWNPSPAGFQVVDQACCNTYSSSDPGIECRAGSIPCENRRTYLFYDGVHYSTALYEYLARKAYFSELEEEVYPFNISRLVTLATGGDDREQIQESKASSNGFVPYDHNLIHIAQLPKIKEPAYGIKEKDM